MPFDHQCFDILQSYFRQTLVLEYETSDSYRMVNRNIYPDAVARDTMRLIGPKRPIRTYSPLFT